MIIDCFLFNDEFPMLDIRLNELKGTVDHHILVEASFTFSGLGKPLHFRADAHRWSNYRISSVEAINPPKTRNPWDREVYQRNSLLSGLREYDDDTVILLSDVDEIPDHSVVPIRLDPGQVVVFNQRLYYYDMHTMATGWWRGTRACRLGDMRRWLPQTVRSAGGADIRPGGWHFSYMGGIGAIQSKIASFSHQEYNNPAYTAESIIDQHLIDRTDLFNRKVIQLHYTSDVELLPQYVKDNPGKYGL